MINIKDYQKYYEDNLSFLEMLQERESIVYDRLSDVIIVLGFIERMVEAKKKITDDLEVFFEVGFSYLHEQLEIIKTYYKNYFNSDYHKFSYYDKLINYSLFLDDLTDVLNEKNKFDGTIKKIIKSLNDEIENILMNKNKYTNDDIDRFNQEIENLFSIKENILTTQEIFAMAVEELGL